MNIDVCISIEYYIVRKLTASSKERGFSTSFYNNNNSNTLNENHILMECADLKLSFLLIRMFVYTPYTVTFLSTLLYFL